MIKIELMNNRVVCIIVLMLLLGINFCTYPGKFVADEKFEPHVTNLVPRMSSYQYVSELGGVQYNVYRSAQRGKTGIIFIHNIGANAYYWVNQLEYFKDQYFVVVPDLLGFGKTGKPDIDYSVESFYNFLKGVMDDQCDNCKWVVVGHSFAGILAMGLASRLPESVIGLVLVDSMGLAPYGMGTGGIWKLSGCLGKAGGFCMKPFANLHEKLLSEQKKKEKIKLALYPLFYQPQKMVSDELVDITFEQSMLPGAKRALTRSQENFFKYYNDGLFSQITCPVLVLWGIFDRYSAAFAYELYGKFKNARVELINNARHIPQFECPNAFNQKLEEFVYKLLKDRND